MSGSDYSLTPNFGLYKPNYALDVGQWGNHLNANADVLDAALVGVIDATTFTTYDHRVWSGGTFNTALGIYGQLSGIQTGGNNCFSRINLVSDTASAGAGLITFLLDQHSGGVGTTGNRIAQYINFNFSGGATNKSVASGDQYGGLFDYCTATGNVGGSAGTGNAWGTLWGGVLSATLASGATFWNGVCGIEVDFGVSAGASATYVNGLKIVLAHHQQAVNSTDFYLGFAKAYLTDAPLANGIMFGDPAGYWPVDVAGTLIGAQPSLLPTPPAMAAAHGVDFSNVTFSADAFKSTGFRVDGTGRVSATRLNLSGLPTSATGLVAGDVWRNGTALNIV